ncbi:MAG TPA: sigma-70 family RNA polymerase sigma factor [Anaerolineales bacterium]|nr:sigma-70 family RNA polymerase sigma factor [Anaerolineales bacterium]
MRTNEEWLTELRADDARQEAAIADLRNLLLRTVLLIFSRNLGDLSRLAHVEIQQLAEDCAQESLIAILDHLDDFRGDSKFTTWAYKFAVNKALTTARRERWKGISLDHVSRSADGDLFDRELQDKSSGSAPDRSVMQDDVYNIIQQVIEHDLTDKQRQVLILVVFNGVPMDEVVQRLGTNRNAIYKMLHDARRKIKSSLQAHGFEVDETLDLFSAPRGDSGIE